jgi:hypothetical protein
MALKKFFYLTMFLIFLSLSLNALAKTPYPWDFLRPLSDLALELNFFTSFLVMFFSIAMFSIAFLAFYKKKSKRLLLVLTAFFFFAVKWVLKVLDFYVSPGHFLSDASENVFELIILALLFVAIFYKKK